MPNARRFSANGWEELEPDLPVESSVALHINGSEWVSLQCLPQELEALAAGFLFNEGLVQSTAEIDLLQPCPDGSMVDIWLNHAVTRPDGWRITSGCGGGKSAALENAPALPVLPAGQTMAASDLLRICADFISKSRNQRIPGTHASGLYAADPGTAPRIAVDIGRHNTLDKLAGQCLLANAPSAGGVLITTGRISGDMLQKAARMGTPWAVSLRSATSLALSLAETLNITLVSNARAGGFDLLSHPERLSA